MHNTTRPSALQLAVESHAGQRAEAIVAAAREYEKYLTRAGELPHEVVQIAQRIANDASDLFDVTFNGKRGDRLPGDITSALTNLVHLGSLLETAIGDLQDAEVTDA